MKLKLMIPTASILLLAFAVWLSPQVDPAPAPARADPSASRDILPAPSAQADTAEQKWLMEHCWEYGFILRYPEDKQDATGIIYEPWHYRYVGKEAALAMKASGQCLEEYLGI